MADGLSCHLRGSQGKIGSAAEIFEDPPPHPHLEREQKYTFIYKLEMSLSLKCMSAVVLFKLVPADLYMFYSLT